MSECKKLRISEIRENVFVIERYDEGDPGKWITLNLKGEEKQDVYTGLGVVVADPCEYTDLESAEQAMEEFIIYPRVIKQSVSEFKVDCNLNGENIYQRFKRKYSVDREATLRAVNFLSNTEKLEELATSLCDIEKSMNEIADDLIWPPFKISIDRIKENVDELINDNLDNPI